MSPDTIRVAKNIQKKYGTSYHLATSFLTPAIRNAVYILYAFVRIPDEYVDNPEHGSDPRKLLQNWKEEWTVMYQTNVGNNDILRATREIFIAHSIPFSLSIEFIDAMISDTTINRFGTYKDLQAYMRGSADVVGLMLTYIFGYSDSQALTYAPLLGSAMQLTNILRDIHEDYLRGRIYIPQEDMGIYGVTEDMIRNKAVTPEFISLMKFEIQRARDLYREAERGIPMLSKESQYAVTVASRLYEHILTAIERQSYDVFTRRARITIIEKIYILIHTYVTH